MGLFNPESREEQARYVYHENARFCENLRENKRKNRAVRKVGHIPVFLVWCDLCCKQHQLNQRPLPPQGSALPSAPHPDALFPALLHNFIRSVVTCFCITLTTLFVYVKQPCVTACVTNPRWLRNSLNLQLQVVDLPLWNTYGYSEKYFNIANYFCK